MVIRSEVAEAAEAAVVPRIAGIHGKNQLVRLMNATRVKEKAVHRN